MRVARCRNSSQALDRLALHAGQGAPLLLAYRVDGLVKGLGDAEVIDDERGLRAMVLDHLGVRTDHVAAGPADMSALVLAQTSAKNRSIASRPSSGPDPHHSGALEVVDQSGEFTSLAVADLVSSDAPEAPDAVSIAPGGDDAVQQPGERRARHADPPFEPIGDKRVAGTQGICSCTRPCVGHSISQGENHRRILTQ